MNVIECIKRLFTGGAIEAEVKATNMFWGDYEKTIIEYNPDEAKKVAVEDRVRCDMCSKYRVLAPIGEMWYDAPVEEVLGGWLVAESYICLCFACTRDYLFQGQLKRREFNGYRN